MNIKKLISSFLLVFCFSGCANQKMTQIESLKPANLSGVNLFCEEQDLLVTYIFYDQNRYETTNYFGDDSFNASLKDVNFKCSRDEALSISKKKSATINF